MCIYIYIYIYMCINYINEPLVVWRIPPTKKDPNKVGSSEFLGRDIYSLFLSPPQKYSESEFLLKKKMLDS